MGLIELRASSAGIKQRLHRNAKRDTGVLPNALDRLDHGKPTARRNHVEVAVGFLGDSALLDDVTIDSEDDRRASNP